MGSTVDAKQKAQRTVKAFETDIDLINQRAKQLGWSAAEVIHGMCEDLRKKVYLEELGESFDLVSASPEQLKKFQAENELWDSTLSDGLEDAP